MGDRRELLNDDEEALRIAMDGQQSAMWTCLPAIVTKVDLTKMTVEAQPAIQGVVTDENNVQTFVDLPLLADVPISFPRAGGFTITFPVKIGDEVLIIFASRGIDWWYQSGGIQKPAEARMHDLSDGIALLGVTSQPNVISAISDTGLQIRNDAGTAYMEITDDGKLKFLGDLEVTGNITATGEVTGHSETLPVNLTTHVHGGVTTGGGSTGIGVG